MDPSGRWALVTGAAKRVGRCIALALGGLGTNVVVHYRSSAGAARETADALAALGVSATCVQADLGNASAVRRLAAAAENATDGAGIAILVNSASNYLRTSWEDLGESDWDMSLDVNAKAPFLLAHVLGRGMQKRGEGSIVNIVDWAADRPYRNYLPYCVSKAALICLTKALATELAPAVRVNAVAPGPVLLPEHFTDGQREAVRKATPLQRIGTPEDVARAVTFLIAEAEFSTGTILHVDGGRAIV